ncbi:damage-control phosphatase [Physcia stellaris]|nr:damage-control phosphatase [Physcia stellaris]
MVLADVVLEPERHMELPVARRMEVVDYVGVRHTVPEVVGGRDYGMALRMVAALAEDILDSVEEDNLAEVAEKDRLGCAVAGADKLVADEEEMLDYAAGIGPEADNPAGRTPGALAYMSCDGPKSEHLRGGGPPYGG